MTKRSLSFLLPTLCVFRALSASAAYIGHPQFAQPDGSHLANDVSVSVTFDYKIDNAAGARFYVTPYHEGTSVAVGLGFLPPILPTGTGTTLRSFYIDSGTYDVDQIRIRMADPATSATLLELFLAVHYTFGDHGFHNIAYSHTFPSWVAHGQDFTATFDYKSTSSEGVRIFARPYTNGLPTPGVTASGSAVLPAEGSGSQWFHFAVDADVTHVRFLMTNADQSQTLIEHFVPVELKWRSDGVANIVTTPLSPDERGIGQNVVVDFDYFTSDPNGCRVWAHGAEAYYLLGFDGEEFSPSMVLPAPSGRVSRWFHLNEGEVDLSHITFYMVDHLNQILLFRDSVPANFRLAPNVMFNATYVPQAPAVLTVNQPVTVDFDYTSVGPEDVRVYPIGANLGEPVPGIIFSAGPLVPPGTGHATRQFYFASPGDVHQALFMMCLGDEAWTVVEQFTREKRYFWGTSGVVTAVPGSQELPAARLGTLFPNPFNAHATIPFAIDKEGPVRLRVFDMRGRLVNTIADEVFTAGSHTVPFDGKGLASGIYFVEFQSGGQRETRRMTLVK